MLRMLAVALLIAPAVFAQMNMAGHVMEMRDEMPPEKLPPPVHMSGIGNAHLKITATAEAQVWFDQGLNLLHDFWDYESARAFEQAVRVDPQCAMCYWGLYKAESFYHSTAQGLAGQALAQAVALKEHASERERLYIDAADAHEHAMHSSNPGFAVLTGTGASARNRDRISGRSPGAYLPLQYRRQGLARDARSRAS